MSNGTYSRAPFISYDGNDAEGFRAEVKVVIGFGQIFEVEASDRGKSAKVVFKVENSKWKSSGWAPVDSNVYKKVMEAEAAGDLLHFRLETRRQDKIDRKLTMDEVSPKGDSTAARENIVKSLAAVRLDSEQEWTISPHAKTRIDEDPQSGGGSPSAYDTPLSELQKGSQSEQSSYSVPNNGKIESTPFNTYNHDGSLNIGSVAVSIPLNFLSYVTEYERTHPELDELTDKRRQVTARLLLSASNQIQMKVYDGKLDAPDLSLGSHTRARALVFEVIRTYLPLTNDTYASADVLKEWRTQIVEKAVELWNWSISEFEKLEG